MDSTRSNSQFELGQCLRGRVSCQGLTALQRQQVDHIAKPAGIIITGLGGSLPSFVAGSRATTAAIVAGT